MKNRDTKGKFILGHKSFHKKSIGWFGQCGICHKKIYNYPSYIKKYCSYRCFWKSLKGKRPVDKCYKNLVKFMTGRPSPLRGRKLSEETKRKMRETAKRKGFGKWMLGKHHTLATKLKISKIGKDRVAAGLHNNYKGGIERINNALKKSLKYKLWRMAVLKRDGFTCIFCNKKARKLHADHIKQWAFYPELRFVVENGRTLCIPCHKNTHTYLNRWINKS